MVASELTRSRVRITDTLADGLERYLEGRGQSLDRPVEIRDSLLAGLVLRRERTGRKCWHFGYTLNGRRGRVKIGNCPALSTEGARKAAKLVAAKVAAGTDPAAEKREQRQECGRKNTKHEQVLGAFLDGPYKHWAEAHLKSHKETLAALKADFGDGEEKGRKQGAGWWKRRMDGLTVQDIEAWRTTELKRGIKHTTINRAWQRLRAALGKAVEWKHIPGPPLRLKKLKTDKRGRVRFLSSEERQKLFWAFEEREKLRREKRDHYNEWRVARHRAPLPAFTGVFTDYLQPLTRTWLATGLRRSEGTQLRWRNLDFELELVNVPGEIAKNSQSRVVPMPPELKECLLIWRAQQGHVSSDDLVFSRKGKRIRAVYKAWKSLMRLAHITNFRVHDCRHDYASRLAMADVSLKTIAELLGHEDLTQVQRYAHLSQKHLRDSTRRLTPDPAPWASAHSTTSDVADAREADRTLPAAA